MTREEIIADERYHTCGRCRWGELNDEFYPCNKCIHGTDKREDFWQYAENEEEKCKECTKLRQDKEFEHSIEWS